MSAKNRRAPEGFGLSFLDVICCGFGAIILLLVLTKIGEPLMIEETTTQLEGQIAKLEEELQQIRGETDVFNRRLISRQEQIAVERSKIARLSGDLSSLRSQYKASRSDSAVADILEESLTEAKQQLSEEMQRLLGQDFQRDPDDNLVGGIPVDSEYIIFVIDTSGSMVNYSWDLAQKKLDEVLDIYPEVKGIQVMNDMGQYMFERYARKWIPDSPVRRRAILERLRTWNAFSNSSPVEGIAEAVRTFYSPDKKISIYVFGDEFTGDSIEEVVQSIDRINIADESGQRRVRIHAIGFPFVVAREDQLQITGVRFATLMSILCRRNGGTFVGLRRHKL